MTEQNTNPGWRLKLVVFVSGAVLMGLEIAGSRVLAIHFGSSIYVWGAIIAVFLAALSAGYYVGGMVADRKPAFLLLNLLVLLAGCWLLVIPLYANPVCRAILRMDLGERLGPLLSTLALFGGPSLLMGMVSPFAVRLAAQSIERIGNVAGRLYALSTLGSIAGTLITAFWLIPAMGVRKLHQLLGVCLLILPVIVLPKLRTRAVVAATMAIVVPALVLLNMFVMNRTRGSKSILYQEDSAYHHILVTEDREQDSRYLQFNNYLQSGISLSPPYETRLPYTDTFELARIFKPNLKSILIIGGGGGVGARKFVADDVQVEVDLVEIDPRVVDVSFKYFYLEAGPRLRVHVADGRQFVRSATRKYDLVILDAFTIGGQIPFHLTTLEFMREIRSILNFDGVVMANVTSRLSDQIWLAQHKTMSAVFQHLYVFSNAPRKVGIHDRNVRANIILIAASSTERWEDDTVIKVAEHLQSAGIVKTPSFVTHARQILDARIFFSHVPLLTDDYAPVDTMAF